MNGPSYRTNLFIGAGGNCSGALAVGVFASALGINAPYWIAFAVAVSVATWNIFNRAAMAQACTNPLPQAGPSAAAGP